MGGGGGRINKPKTAVCRTDNRKVARQRARDHKKPHSRSEETVKDTTFDKLRQCRSNPRANVRLSGKKKRFLLKEAKRLAAEKAEMEVTGGKGSSDGAGVGETVNSVTEAMETVTSIP